MSSRASPGGSSALRTRCTRRSLLVTVPSDSHHAAAAGSTTSASSAVFVRKMSCTTMWSSALEQPQRARSVGLGLRGVLADDVERAQVAALHRLEHLAQVPSARRPEGCVPYSRSNLARRSAFSTSCPPTNLLGIAPMSPPPCTLFWPRSGTRPDPYRPTCPVSSARLMIANTLSTALWCSVMPSVQQTCARSARAYAWAISRIVSAATPVMRAACSSVYGSTLPR